MSSLVPTGAVTGVADSTAPPPVPAKRHSLILQILKKVQIMCELLGISNSRPVNTQELLHAFRRRGGETADNSDGWGIAFLRADRFTLHKEPLPAAHSQGSECATSSRPSLHLRLRLHPILLLFNSDDDGGECECECGYECECECECGCNCLRVMNSNIKQKNKNP